MTTVDKQSLPRSRPRSAEGPCAGPSLRGVAPLPVGTRRQTSLPSGAHPAVARRQLRAVDACVLVGVVALLGLVFALAPTGTPRAGPPAVLSVGEAIAVLSDDPLRVRGWLVIRGRRTLLCDGPRCAGPRLAVVGLGASRPTGRVLVLGTVAGGRIVPAPLVARGLGATL